MNDIYKVRNAKSWIEVNAGEATLLTFCIPTIYDTLSVYRLRFFERAYEPIVDITLEADTSQGDVTKTESFDFSDIEHNNLVEFDYDNPDLGPQDLSPVHIEITYNCGNWIIGAWY